MNKYFNIKTIQNNKEQNFIYKTQTSQQQQHRWIIIHMKIHPGIKKGTVMKISSQSKGEGW